MSGAGASRRRADLSADALPLALPTPRVLPGHVRLEAAVPCSQPFDDPDWRFSVDWDGARAMLVAGPGGVTRLRGETGADLTTRYPELTGAGEELAARAAVLDGVIAVLDGDGRPDLHGFGRRLALGGEGAGMLPVAFLATDVLHLDGASTLAWPLDQRLEALAGLVKAGDGVQVPDHVSGRGRALAEAALERGLSALLARRGDAAYHAGMASPHRLRVALTLMVTCAVVGIEHRRHRPMRLVLGLHEAGRLGMAGWVTGPHDMVIERWLERTAAPLTGGAPPAGFGSGEAVTWLRPGLTATVSHHGSERDGTLRRPALLAVRDDVDPAWCMRREPVPPPRSTPPDGGFQPTLLVPLPLDDAVSIKR